MNCIGIDLGTTNSVAGTLENGRYVYFQYDRENLLPSAILYKDGKVTVGSRAKKRSVVYSGNFIASAKTFMGNIKPQWNIEGRDFNATDVATEVLKEIYKVAKKHFGNDDPIQAVITTPAYFSGSQNAETAKAGEAAGFIVKQILAEPVAAALAYAYGDTKVNETIYVVDLGGGTFDLSIIKNKGNNHFETIMKGGDRKLGGDDFDIALLEYMINHIRRDIGIDLSTCDKSGLDKENYSKAKQKLVIEAETVKCALSDADSYDVNMINLFPYKNSTYDLEMKITRDNFLECANDLVKRVQRLIRNSFDEIDIGKDDIDKIILVGGSCKMPFVREFITQFFGKQPYDDKDLSKLVAMGAILLSCDTNNTSGIKIKVDDIIAHSMGIELVDDRFSIILPKNMVYPCKNTEVYTTTYDNQESVDINIYEGEDVDNVNNNTFYGGFTLDNIQKARAGVPEIEVTFEYDASCILHISARDLKTGSQNSKEIAIDVGNAKKKPRKSKVDPYDIVVLLDNSGSMSSAMSIAKDACRKLVNDMIDTNVHRIAFITFESFIDKLCGLTHNKYDVINSINGVYAKGSTDMAGAIDAAFYELKMSNNKHLVILVTDGAPDSKPSTALAAEKLKASGATLVCIGAGYGVDYDFLRKIASGHENCYEINTMSALEGIFKTITSGLRLK